MNEDPKDPREEFEELMKTINSKNQFKSMAYRLGLIVHPKFSMHILILTIINILVGFSLVGITDAIGLNLVDTDYMGLIFSMLLFSGLEIIIKLLLYRYILKYIVVSFGLILYVVNILILLAPQFLIPSFTFVRIESSIFIFTILFMLLRLPFTIYVRKAKWIKKGDF